MITKDTLVLMKENTNQKITMLEKILFLDISMNRENMREEDMMKVTKEDSIEMNMIF